MRLGYAADVSSQAWLCTHALDHEQSTGPRFLSDDSSGLMGGKLEFVTLG